MNDSIIHYLSDNASDEQLKLLLAYHLKRRQFQKAENLLNQPSGFRWSTAYVDMMTMLTEAMQNPKNADAFIAQHEPFLRAIAADENRDAYLAQSILQTYGLAEYHHNVIMPEPQRKSLFKDKSESAPKNKPIASVHPNPARSVAYLTWRLPEGLPASEIDLVIYNVQGLPVLSKAINDEVGIQEINTTNWSPGLYIFQLRHQDRLLHNGRFEIIH